MISAEENKHLMEVGPGTLMGELMRRYWQPVAAVAELDDNPIKPLRLMGEDLVMYKDKSGTYGLVDLHCPHRRADLSYGILEECGLRCNYHGWKFDETGACIEQPFEEVAYPDAHFKEKTTIKAYKVESKAGLLWAYMGPDPAPLVPDYDAFSDPGYKQVSFTEIPCNWFQGQENSIDPVHLEWLHGRWSYHLTNGATREPKAHIKVGFGEFDYGLSYHRVNEGSNEEDEQWTVGRVCLWPNALWFNDPVPGDEPFEQERVPYWTSPLVDEKTGRWLDTHIMNQDYIAWVGQNALADRTQEHLGGSDGGIILMRRRMLEEARIVADGGEPKAVIRDPEKNKQIYLPKQGRNQRRSASGTSMDGKAPRNVHLAKQPQAILDEMDKIWAERTASAAKG
jgi:5,5'-dehydrodivanillate O-demethylase